MRCWLAALLACCGGALAAAQAPPSAAALEWQRAWTLHDFDCPACGAEDRAWLTARLGQVVTFGATRFLNPLYEDCPASVDYGALRRRSPAAAAALLGPGRLPPLVTPSPLAGSVRCAEADGPANTVARVVIDGPRAYLLHESGAVLHLR